MYINTQVVKTEKMVINQLLNRIARPNVACSRLRDSGEKSFSKKKCVKRAGLGRDRAAELVRR